MNRLREVLDRFSTAQSVIIDARPYVGGALEETDIMASYFFAKPTILLHIDIRQDVEKSGFSPLGESATLRRISGPKGVVRREQVAVPSKAATKLRQARIFLLTSRATASGGEGFTLSMKHTGRATIIGEATAGAGHLGRTTPLTGGYRSFNPVGRPFDPATGKGWEQTGVDPHVKVPRRKRWTKRCIGRASIQQWQKRHWNRLKPTGDSLGGYRALERGRGSPAAV